MPYYDRHSGCYECDTCTRQFATQRACNQHMNDTDHWQTYDCEVCDKEFCTQRAANQHMDALGHWEEEYYPYECETCTARYISETAVQRHMKKAEHYKYYCKACEKAFQNQNNLNMHLKSKVHIGNGVKCPFCKTGYTTASGLAHHLERASCPKAPNMNRETILRKVRECDPHGRFTTKQITWDDDEEDNSHYSATDRAYNGRSWECYICNSCFKYRSGLNNHLNSPVHKQNVYRCPNRRSKCGKEFVTLAALFNHLESESCAVVRFEAVQRGVKDLIVRGRMITC
ncbi:hypothetical protein MGYG_07366 [Nannizzia gypsea CBS 118893]|uniref:C2H2-type domain-containing protein n=1 Tax=Arthroderma gypseum (strain ATCC MYA-4604 / CBS 118893) TaxID=535722 RepID=E4V2Y4_ARTGP|nr:hypothetical protein MGYG_07366 [Nannizzia gypsea CBS 118893]EFR04358.1 hypothetical protein MGYG_07366 [Nannizzia gypsea CBS 118893]